MEPCLDRRALARAFNLQLKRPSKFTGLSARTPHRRAAKDARPTIQAMADFTIAYLVSMQ
ncbi:MAG: hypothetical protein ACRECZ_06490 [Methylocella sp.]